MGAGGTIVLVSTAVFLVALVGAPQHGLVSGWLQRRRGYHHAHHYHPMEEDVPVH